MRIAFMVVFAGCLVGQAAIVSGQALHSVPGIIILALLALIEALLLAVWLITEKHHFDMAKQQEESEEEQAEIAQTSRLPEMRGLSIAKHVRATGDRLRILWNTVLGSVLPMLLVAILGIAAAVWLAGMSLAN